HVVAMDSLVNTIQVLIQKRFKLFKRHLRYRFIAKGEMSRVQFFALFFEVFDSTISIDDLFNFFVSIRISVNVERIGNVIISPRFNTKPSGHREKDGSELCSIGSYRTPD